ncbi:MAG: transposase [Candidatus Adiutrix intracellularis]|jgi:hypothetical protein|nr:transposase [Candidatus Adiutrix intracellularis]
MSQGPQSPSSKKTKSLARYSRKNDNSYLHFVINLKIKPTNNLAEQPIYFVVLDRTVTQGPCFKTRHNWLKHI